MDAHPRISQAQVRPPKAACGCIRVRALIKGMVQGVGFRPYVFRLASEKGLAGQVRNEGRGVFLELEGPQDAVREFFEDLIPHKPPLAQISKIEQEQITPLGQRGFLIMPSQACQTPQTLISPDVGICSNCLRELNDPGDRRFGHPFINCTDCGPRYTIIKGLPYDRPLTTMAGFSMCPQCGREYHDPKSRRFHAQPVACPQCGPRLWLSGPDGRELPGDPLAGAGRLLSQGRILAVKGLGGFHLAVDACNEKAVLRLRQRKHREQKPLAVMVPDLAAARGLVKLNQAEAELLGSDRRPILLAALRTGHGLAPGIAPGLDRLGVMIAYTPLHHLLLKAGPRILVMTSGNLSDQPICTGNREALDVLGEVADYFLLHDREIQSRIDDSVAISLRGRTRVLRRARGYAPRPVHLHTPGPRVLALGPELKNTFCLARGDQAFLSPHIGDLQDAQTLEFYLETLRRMRDLLKIEPQALAVDLHPDYLSTRQAERFAGLPVIRVQHHAAHALSAMAESGLEGPIIALSLDGAGLGLDGSVWGCEIMKVGPNGFRRLGGLRPAPLPGGDKAARQPWRSAAGRLFAALGPEWHGHIPAALYSHISSRCEPGGLELFNHVMARGLNSPGCSSLGRLFDAAAAIIGLRYEAAYEGQAAMELEGATLRGERGRYALKVGYGSGGADTWLDLDPAPMLESMLDDLKSGCSKGIMAARFHNGLIMGLAHAAVRAARAHGCKTVALSGGCMMNRRLSVGLSRALEQEGMEAVLQQEAPCNDGGVSLGQVLAARLALAGGDLDIWAKQNN